MPGQLNAGLTVVTYAVKHFGAETLSVSTRTAILISEYIFSADFVTRDSGIFLPGAVMRKIFMEKITIQTLKTRRLRGSQRMDAKVPRRTTALLR